MSQIVILPLRIPSDLTLRCRLDDRMISHLVVCAPNSQISRFVCGGLYFFPSQRDVVNYNIPAQIVCVRACGGPAKQRVSGRSDRAVTVNTRGAEESPRSRCAVDLVTIPPRKERGMLLLLCVFFFFLFLSTVKATASKGVKSGSARQTQGLGALRSSRVAELLFTKALWRKPSFRNAESENPQRHRAKVESCPSWVNNSCMLQRAHQVHAEIQTSAVSVQS